jgi:hypothetical protein
LSQHWPIRPTESVTLVLLGEHGIGSRLYCRGGASLPRWRFE